MKHTLARASALLFACSITIAQSETPAPRQSVTSDHPIFRIYYYKTGEGIVSVVVPPKTTDEQLKRLLWFFRQNVRTGWFRQIGLNRPTDRRFGKLGYGAGILAVYRGEKCANEQFIDSLGPCGYGEHDDASYQWGIDGIPSKDAAEVRGKNGDMVAVFDYKDNWHPK